jgi:small-conductance mechanosensitive channel
MSERVRVLLALAIVAMLPASGRLLAQATAGADADVLTAPVVLDGATLFRVRGSSSLPPQERARMVAERIAAVASDENIPVESLRIVDTPEMTRILAGDQLVVALIEADATVEQVKRPELAAIHMARVKQAITEYRIARSSVALRRGAVNALIATVILAGAVVGVIAFWRWMDRLLRRRFQARIQSVQIQKLELIRGDRIWSVLRTAVYAFRTVVVLGLVLIYIGYVLGQFPWTRGAAVNMVSFALGPLEVMGRGFVTRIPSLVFLIVLFFVVRLALKLIRMFFDAVDDGTVKLAQFDQDWAVPTYKIVRLGVIAFALVVAYPYIPGSNTAAFGGVSLFIGVLFSLGSSSAISNIIAGYMLTYRHALKVGERVQIGSAFGDVIETRLQATHIRSIKNEEIIIPNSQILASEVINYSTLARTQGLILHTEIGIGYDTPWRQVEALLLSAADRTAGVSKDQRPFVREKKLGEFAVTYELNVYTREAQQMAALYAELHRNILDAFNEAGIQIMTPAYEGDPPEPKVVQPKDWHKGGEKVSEQPVS